MDPSTYVDVGATSQSRYLEKSVSRLHVTARSICNLVLALYNLEAAKSYSHRYALPSVKRPLVILALETYSQGPVHKTIPISKILSKATGRFRRRRSDGEQVGTTVGDESGILLDRMLLEKVKEQFSIGPLFTLCVAVVRSLHCWILVYCIFTPKQLTAA